MLAADSIRSVRDVGPRNTGLKEAKPLADWRVKYDGMCARCGTPLLRGEVAVWDRSTRTMHCVECPSPREAAHLELPLDVGIPGSSARREFERRKVRRQVETRDR